MSNIEWTDKTWNPVIGCSPVSEGCRFCYAERMAVRLSNMGRNEYDGLTNGDLRQPRWTGQVRFMPERLDTPKGWRNPCMVFVNSMSDLLHPKLDVQTITRIIDVMEQTPRHIYQVLTKRPERLDELYQAGVRWPDNVWLGVSLDDQEAADTFLPHLAARRFARLQWVSYEPAIDPVNWVPWLTHLDWIVVGGESGPGSRVFDLQWARDTLTIFHAAGLPVFIKQLGTRWAGHGRKGKKMPLWPADLRVRTFPAV